MLRIDGYSDGQRSIGVLGQQATVAVGHLSKRHVCLSVSLPFQAVWLCEIRRKTINEEPVIVNVDRDCGRANISSDNRAVMLKAALFNRRLGWHSTTHRSALDNQRPLSAAYFPVLAPMHARLVQVVRLASISWPLIYFVVI